MAKTQNRPIDNSKRMWHVRAQARAFLSYARRRRIEVALFLAATALAFCGMSWWYTYRTAECVAYAMGDISVSPPEYCFAKLGEDGK